MKTLLLLISILLANFTYSQSASEHFQKATDYEEIEEYKKALNEINKALEIEPENCKYLDEKGALLVSLEKFQDAYDAFTKSITLERNALSLNARALLFEKVGEFDMAIKDFSTALRTVQFDSLKYMIYMNRATAKLLKRDFQGAYDDLIISYNYDSTQIGVLTNLGSVCDEIEKGDETLKYLLKAIEIDSTFFPAYGNIGYKYQEMGQHEKAIEYYNKVLEFEPNQPLGFSNRSYNKYKLGDLKGAMKDITTSLKLYPENSYGHRIKALIYIAEDKINKACDELESAIHYGFTATYGNEVIDLQKKHCKK